jgi:putative OPT family oligopeptide transporter
MVLTQPAVAAGGQAFGSRELLTGGLIAWAVAIPWIAMTSGAPVEGSALDLAWTLWSTQVRYIGVGAMVVGGMWSLLGVRKSFVSGVKALGAADTDRKDLSPMVLGILLLTNIIIMAFLYHHLIGSWGMSLLTTFAMVIASFLFVAVSSYVVGLVGTSNNPVSGMTISALLGTSAFFLVCGFHGESAILATLGVAGVVCCAACTAGDSPWRACPACSASRSSTKASATFVPTTSPACMLASIHKAGRARSGSRPTTIT